MELPLSFGIRALRDGGSSLQLRARVDGRRTRASCETGTNKFFQGSILNLVRLEVADMSDQKPNVPCDHLGASRLARLSEVSRGAVAE